jgi:hypothetical protein
MPKNCPLGKEDSHACWECLYSCGNSCTYTEVKEEEDPEVVYAEKHIATASTVQELISILSEQIPATASVEVACSYHCADAEVWYDEGTDTVIIK